MIHGSTPNIADSDGDGTNDGDEVSQGSDPKNSSDAGQPPPAEEMVDVPFSVGDPSGSHSERWRMNIQADGPDDTRHFGLVSPSFGQTHTQTFKLRRGNNYTITVSHVATNEDNGPDYDWEAQVGGKPTTKVLSGGLTHPQADRFEVIQETWILDNEAGLLGKVNQSFRSTNHASGKVARLLKVDLESIDFKGTGNQELLKTDNDDWDNDDYASVGDVTIDYPEWDLGGAGVSDDKNEPACYIKGSTIQLDVIINLPVSGVSFDLVGTVEGKEYLSFEKTGITSTGQAQTVTLNAKEALPQKIDIYEEEIEWEIRLGSTTAQIGNTGSHRVYSVWNEIALRGGGPTVKRLDWATSGTKEATTIAEAAERISNQIASNPGCSSNDPEIPNSWAFLDSGFSGDCFVSSRLAAVSLDMVGIVAYASRAWPTADGTGWPGAPASVSTDSCKNLTTDQFTSSGGETFTGWLGYPGNRFEGFFYTDDPSIKAYTVFPVGGPFENQNYFYLEVLRSVTPDQYWIDPLIEGTSNRIIDPSTGQPYPILPVPAIP